jgi:hypothetical protein
VSSTQRLLSVQLPPRSQPLSPTHSLTFMQVEFRLHALTCWHVLSREHRDAPQWLSVGHWLSSVQVLVPMQLSLPAQPLAALPTQPLLS